MTDVPIHIRIIEKYYPGLLFHILIIDKFEDQGVLWVNATGVMRPKRERETRKKKLMEAEKERENGVDDQLCQLSRIDARRREGVGEKWGDGSRMKSF